MAAPASTLKHLDRAGLLPGVSSRREVPGVLGKYQFQVVSASIADAVMSIGGLMYDRAMAGWEVSVVVDGDNRTVDDRPVRILGARVAGQLSEANDARALARPNVLAVASDVMVKSDAVRRRVLAMGDANDAVVLLWGRHHPTNLSRTFVADRHQPSAAAQVFKSHALVAGGARAIQRADEDFYSMS